MNILIRRISQKYAERCIAIQKNDGYQHAYYLTIERIKRLLSNGEWFVGAFHSRELIGFASINDDIVRLRIHFFVVSKKYQGIGVGTMLLAYILGYANKRHISSIYTYAEIKSPLESFLLYKGFKKAGYFKKRFRNKDATILAIYS